MKKITNVLLAIIFGIALTGCHETFEHFFNEDGKKAGWSEEQILAAKYEAYKILFLKPKGKEYEIFYSRLTNEEVLSKTNEMLNTLKEELAYTNERTVKYIDLVAQARPFLEHQERTLEAIARRLHARELQNIFNKLNGIQSQTDKENGEGEHVVDIHTRYAPETIFVLDPRTIFNSSLAQVDEARKLGALKEIQTFLYNTDMLLAYKEQDPNDPADQNKFLWKPQRIGLELRSYKIFDGKPKDSKPHYIEGHRVWLSSDTEGKQIIAYREVRPALQVFYKPDQDNGIEVIDSDLEYESGYGIPDIVRASGTITRLDAYAMGLINDIYPIKAKQHRIKPEKQELAVEIAPIGEPVNVWEFAPNLGGWKIPMVYQNDKRDNYHVKLKFKMPEITGKDDIKILSSLKKEWHGNHLLVPSVGWVFEYYKLKFPYNEKLADARVLYKEDTKKITFILLDGEERRGMIVPGPNTFIADKPYAIEYSDGDIRWRLESTKEDGVYDRRKRIAQPETGLVGEYEKTPEPNGGNDHHGH